MPACNGGKVHGALAARRRSGSWCVDAGQPGSEARVAAPWHRVRSARERHAALAVRRGPAPAGHGSANVNVQVSAEIRDP
jgi:hypothetical protein